MSEGCVAKGATSGPIHAVRRAPGRFRPSSVADDPGWAATAVSDALAVGAGVQLGR